MHHPLTSVSVTVIHVKNLTNWAKSELTLASDVYNGLKFPLGEQPLP